MEDDFPKNNTIEEKQEENESDKPQEHKEEKSTEKRDWRKIGACGTLIIAGLAFLNFIWPLIRPPVVKIQEEPPPKPQVIIKFEPKPPYIVQNMVGTDTKQYPVYHFRCDIINNSGEATAKNCEIKLTSIEHFDNKKGKYVIQDDFEIQRLRYPIKMPFNVVPKGRVRAMFGQIAHHDFQQNKPQRGLHSGNIDEPQFLFLVDEYYRRLQYNIKKGMHRFTLSVFCTNSPPVNKKFEVEWFEIGKNDWPKDYKELAKYIIIKKKD